MSRLLRCTACGKDMVLEPYHTGRDVPCPWCRATNAVPRELEFRDAKLATHRDETVGAWLLGSAILSLVLCGACVPLGAFVWWYANGRMHRATDEDRPTDPMLRAARIIAALSVVLGLILLSIVLVGALS